MQFRKVYWRLSHFLRSWKLIVALADAQGREGFRCRKSRVHRILDLSYIALRWNEYSTAYYAQRGDTVGVSVFRDWVTVGQFNEERAERNKNPAYPNEDYSVVFEDKLLFERYFSGQGLPVVKSYGLLFPHYQYQRLPHNEHIQLREQGYPKEFQDAFCKPLAGRYGKGAFTIRIEDAGLSAGGDSSKELMPLSVDGPYLVQERVRQHRDIAKFHESSLNTIRLVSFLNRSGGVEVVAGFFRMGSGGSVVDNASAGGVICSLDIETGALGKIGYICGKNSFFSIEQHPTSHVRFEKFQLPWFDDAADLVRQAHGLAPWIRSVGWDVAITENGPLLIEGNHRWGPLSLVWLDPIFLKSARAKLSYGS